MRIEPTSDLLKTVYETTIIQHYEQNLVVEAPAATAVEITRVMTNDGWEDDPNCPNSIGYYNFRRPISWRKEQQRTPELSFKAQEVSRELIVALTSRVRKLEDIIETLESPMVKVDGLTGEKSPPSDTLSDQICDQFGTRLAWDLHIKGET